MKRLLSLVILTFSLLLSGCNNVRIAEDISQNEANQIIATLARHGIYASSERSDTGRDSYSVKVDNSFYIQAKTILVDNSLPKKESTSFAQIVEARGLLPNSREIEALRLDHAMAVELEEALNAHPDLSRAKVVVRSHSGEQGNQRAVSVIVQQKSGRDFNDEELKNIIKKTVPGVSDENLVIALSEEREEPADGTVSLDQKGVQRVGGKEVYVPLTHFLFDWQIPEADYNDIVIVLIICFLVIGIIGWLVGYWYGYFKNSKLILDNTLPDLNIRNLRLDRGERGPTSEI